MRCIYCKNEITSENCSVEHVFPQAFGCPKNWVLHCVCRACNTEFGQTVERRLAGDSIEGLWRLQRIGSRSKKPIAQTRIELHVPDEEKFGRFRGAFLYADFAHLDSLYLPPQIILLDDTGTRKFMLLKNMTDEDIKKITGNFGVCTNSESEYKEAIARLEKFGKKTKEGEITFFPKDAINEGKIEIDVKGWMDKEIFRAISKIAFNYLAKVKGADFNLDERFDLIRHFVKTGIGPDFRVVGIEKGRILSQETSNAYAMEGHIFTVETRGSEIISKISLSNTFDFYYVVRLGAMGPIWHDIKSGHAYSFKENKMIELFSPTFLGLFSRLKINSNWISKKRNFV